MIKKPIGRPPVGATVSLTIHLTPVQYRKIQALAIKADRSITAEMRRIIDKATA